MDTPWYQQEFIRCGKPSCRRCPHGPYWYQYWWANGKTRKKYIGKRLPDQDERDDLVREQQLEKATKELVAIGFLPQIAPDLTSAQAWEVIGLKPTRNPGMVRARVNSLRKKAASGQCVTTADVGLIDRAYAALCKEFGWK